jgi:hypothetical protein
MHPPKPNSVEPPWYGPVCPVVWEGWHREVSPYPDLGSILPVRRASDEWPLFARSRHSVGCQDQQAKV